MSSEEAEQEAERRVERIRTMVGFPDREAAWWSAGFVKGAEWAREAS